MRSYLDALGSGQEGFRICVGCGFWVQNSEFRVEGFRVGVEGLEFAVWGVRVGAARHPLIF